MEAERVDIGLTTDGFENRNMINGIVDVTGSM